MLEVTPEAAFFSVMLMVAAFSFVAMVVLLIILRHIWRTESLLQEVLKRKLDQ